MTVGAKINYARAIKLDLTFSSFGFYIFEVFFSLLNSRRRLQDVQTETIRSERVDNHLCLRVLRHAQQQDKLNAKRIIHGICSIFRFFLYQINTKFVLTASRRIHFLSSIHQHLNHAPQKKKDKQVRRDMTTSWRHNCHATTILIHRHPKTILRKFGRFRASSGYLRMEQMTLLKGLSSARSKTVCKIRIADKKRTENLSKISLRRQFKFTKSERLCSIDVVLSYWLERPGKLNFHQSFNAVDRETFRDDRT